MGRCGNTETKAALDFLDLDREEDFGAAVGDGDVDYSAFGVGGGRTRWCSLMSLVVVMSIVVLSLAV